jgi:hypothetical protein
MAKKLEIKWSMSSLQNLEYKKINKEEASREVEIKGKKSVKIEGREVDKVFETLSSIKKKILKIQEVLRKENTLEAMKIDSKGRGGKNRVNSRKESNVVIEGKDSKVAVEKEKVFKQAVSKLIID